MAHRLCLLPLNEAIPGGRLHVEARLLPDMAMHRSWTAAQFGMRWDASKLQLEGQLPAKPTWAPRMRGWFPTVGFYGPYQAWEQGTAVYTLWGPLGAGLQEMPEDGLVLTVLDFTVLAGEPSVVEVVRNLDDDPMVLVDTIVFRGDVAGLPYLPDELELVNAEIVPDASQTPPPTREQVLFDALSAAAMEHGVAGEQLVLQMKLHSAVNVYLNG